MARGAQPRPRVVVVDHDDGRARKVTHVLRSTSFTVVARGHSTASGLALARACRPDAVVIGMRGAGDLLAMVRELRREALAKVVVVAAEASVPQLADLLTAGASGFVHEDDLGHLPSSLAGALRGEPALSRALLGHLLEEYRSRDLRRAGLHGIPGAERLTAREREILEMLDRGETTQGIARRLVVEPATVRSHIAAAVHKLGVASRQEAVTLLSAERVRTDSPAPAAPAPRRPVDGAVRTPDP